MKKIIVDEITYYQLPDLSSFKNNSSCEGCSAATDKELCKALPNCLTEPPCVFVTKPDLIKYITLKLMK
jgi:hypothetical protein